MIEAPITTAAATPTVGPGPKEETPEAGTLPAPQAQRYIDLARTAFKRYLCIHWPSFRVNGCTCSWPAKSGVLKDEGTAVFSCCN